MFSVAFHVSEQEEVSWAGDEGYGKEVELHTGIAKITILSWVLNGGNEERIEIAGSTVQRKNCVVLFGSEILRQE